MKINLFTLISTLLVSGIVGFFTSFQLLVAFYLLIILPGLLLVELLLPEDLFEFWEKIIISPAIGFTLVSSLVYIFSLLNVQISGGLIAGIVVLLVASTLFYKRKDLSDLEIYFDDNIYFLIFISLFAFYLIVIFLPTSGMDVPLFADSSLHGTIVRLFSNNGLIPETWDPYAPINFNHQPGFGSIVFWFTYFSELTIPKLILYITNIIYALIPASLFFFSRSIYKNWKYNFLVYFLGMASIFPLALFRSGSNATVLTYLLVPIFSGVVFKLLSKDKINSLKTTLFLTISFSGALLIHPLFGVFMAFLFVPFVLIKREWNFTLKISFWKSLIIATVLACLLASFFLFSSSPNYDLLENQWDRQVEYINPQTKISPLFFIEPIFFLFDNPGGSQINESWYFYLEDFSIREIASYPIAILFTVLFIYAIILIFKKKFIPGFYGLSIYFLFLIFSWIQSYFKINFPGWTALYPTRFKFFIILPVALILASLVLVKINDDYLKKLITFVFGFALLVSIFRNGVFLRDINYLQTTDGGGIEAIEWIDENSPKDSLFVNMITEVDSGVFIGGAAQWIPSFTGNPVLFPSLSLTEDVDRLEDRLVIMKALERGDATEEYFLNLLKSYDADYIYFSRGRMHSPNKEFRSIDNNQFKSPYYNLEFNEGVTYIYSINYEDY